MKGDSNLVATHRLFQRLYSPYTYDDNTLTDSSYQRRKRAIKLFQGYVQGPGTIECNEVKAPHSGGLGPVINTSSAQ